MTITINFGGREFLIGADGLQHTLYEKVVSEQGNERDEVIGYFKTFGNAVEKIIRVHLGSQDEIVSLREYVERYEKAVQEIKSANECEF